MKHVLTAYIFCDFQIFSNDHILHFKEKQSICKKFLMSQGPEAEGGTRLMESPPGSEAYPDG